LMGPVRISEMDRYEILLEAKSKAIMSETAGPLRFGAFCAVCSLDGFRASELGPANSVLNPTLACWWESYLKGVFLSHHA